MLEYGEQGRELYKMRLEKLAKLDYIASKRPWLGGEIVFKFGKLWHYSVKEII